MSTLTPNTQSVIPICDTYNSNDQILGTGFIILLHCLYLLTPLLRPHCAIHTGLSINMYSGARSEEPDL